MSRPAEQLPMAANNAPVEAPPGLDFSTVLANSIHDMKNSLGVVLGMLDEVAEVSNGAAGEQLQKVRYEGRRVNNHLVELLAIYRMHHHGYQARLDEHVVADFLEELAQTNAGMLRSRNIDLQIDCDPDLVGFFDQDLIASVFNNVINNAYRYTREQLCLRGEERDGSLVLTVADDGDGYPPHMQVAAGTKPGDLNMGAGSAGLGLYFAAQVAALHRHRGRSGEIRCDNEGINGGGRFSILIP